MRISNARAYNPEYTVGVHEVTIPAPLNEAVRIVQARLDTYVNYGRVIGQSVVSHPCTIGNETRYIYESTIRYEVFA